MTKASRVAAISVLVLLPGGTLSAQERPPIAERIAKTHGLDSFGEVEGIHFRFTLDSKDLKLSQTWDWEPKKDEVSHDGKDKTGKLLKATYRRSELSSQSAAVKDEVDPAFQNAQYWLLFPLHLSWDSSAKVEDTGTHKLPLGKGSATRVVVTYPPQGGYTSGDIWELFVGTDGRVRQFTRRRGGSAEPTVVASWDGYKKAGPLLVSLEHRGDPERQTAACLLLRRVGQADGLEHLGERAVSCRQALSTGARRPRDGPITLRQRRAAARHRVAWKDCAHRHLEAAGARAPARQAAQSRRRRAG
jgi:hypothetical protein